MTLRIEFLDEDGEPVQGHVGFQPSGVSLLTNQFGFIEIREADAAGDSSCVIIPTDGHWTTRYYPVNQRRKLVCQKASVDQINWWKSITGISKYTQIPSQFKVAILDVGFRVDGEYSPIHVDVESNKTEFTEAYNKYHGYNIYSIISSSGIFKKENIIISDVSYFFNREKADLDKLIAAIYNIADDHSVDFINISYGIYLDMDDEDDIDTYNILSNAVAYAQMRGCIVFAAVGNDEGRSPAMPAASDETIGVGSIGKRALAPRYTIGARRELRSVSVPDAHGLTTSGDKVFHDVTTCHGEGLDIVAPGISVFTRCGGDHVIELFGTSFACPIALSALAAILSRDVEFGTIPLESRYEYVRNRLSDWCQNLGIARKRQGHGLAVYVDS